MDSQTFFVGVIVPVVLGVLLLIGQTFSDVIKKYVWYIGAFIAGMFISGILFVILFSAPPETSVADSTAIFKLVETAVYQVNQTIASQPTDEPGITVELTPSLSTTQPPDLMATQTFAAAVEDLVNQWLTETAQATPTVP